MENFEIGKITIESNKNDEEVLNISLNIDNKYISDVEMRILESMCDTLQTILINAVERIEKDNKQ